MTCGFCNSSPTESWLSSWCVECAMLRRLLLVNEPKKCIEILKRVLLRNDKQITNKINLEIQKETVSDDQKDYEKPKTRATKSFIDR